MIPPEALLLWHRLAGLMVRRSSLHAAVGARWDGLGVHRHRVTTLVVALSGQVRVDLGRTVPVDLAAGEALVLGPWCWHAHPPPRHGAAAILGSTQHGVDLIIAWPNGEWRTQTLDREAGQRLADLESLADAARSPAVATLLHRLATAELPTSAVSVPVQQMSDFLWLHRTRPISAAAVLAASGLGPRAAHTLFTSHFAETPKQYLLRCRLALAQRLLAEGRTSGDIWRECGFSSRADLSRRFRLACGIPPRRWARQSGF